MVICICRFTRDLINCQSAAVENNCDVDSLNIHRNITYQKTSPLMEELQCPEGNIVLSEEKMRSFFYKYQTLNISNTTNFVQIEVYHQRKQ